MRFDANVLNSFLRKVYKGFDTSREVEPTMWREIVRVISEGAVEGLARAKTPPTHDRLFYDSLRHSIEVFAAHKTHTIGVEMSAKLLDANGHLKPFRQWVQDVGSISSHQCGAWLRTEYDTAVLRAHAAADWREFERNKDIFPNLRWVKSTSPNPGADHRPFWGTILPVDHPFWDEHRPGDRWNCKCELESTDEPPTPVPDGDSISNPQHGLDNNPGKDGNLFNDTHPYFPSDCSRCFAYKNGGLTNRLKALFMNREKDCYNCPFINGCLYGSERNHVSEIKKEARKSLQGSTISHEKLEGVISISRRSIDEWTNQPHIHFAEKNRMLLYIDRVLKDSTYLGWKDDISAKPGTKWVHLFETSIQGDKTWIIVKEYVDGSKILYSISDGPNILKGLKRK